MTGLYFFAYAWAYRFLPGFDRLAHKYARVSAWNNRGFPARALRKGFWGAVYYRLPEHKRSRVQQILMGEEQAAFWAKHHAESRDIAGSADNLEAVFPPARGASKVGGLDFFEAFPIFDYINQLLGAGKNIHTIQVGASSGKEIAWLSRSYPGLHFTGTDLYDSVIEIARKSYQLENLKFLQASAENAHLIAGSVEEEEIAIFTNGAALYIFPELLPLFFGRLFHVGKKVHVLICEPNSADLLDRKTPEARSVPVTNMGYDHDYAGYGQQAGFSIVAEKALRPYAEGPYPHSLKRRVINFVHLTNA